MMYTYHSGQLGKSNPPTKVFLRMKIQAHIGESLTNNPIVGGLDYLIDRPQWCVDIITTNEFHHLHCCLS